VVVLGFEHPGGSNTESATWLPQGDALRLLAEARPDQNIPLGEKRELVRMALDSVGQWSSQPTSADYGGQWGEKHPIQRTIRERIAERASALEKSHKRIRRVVSLQVRELEVKPQLPPDLLGILVLQPVVTP
jgi:hypothetical protein